MLAKDIMRTDVITVAPYLTLMELAKLFDERRISGAPVVDGDGRLLGVISQTDLVHAEREDAAGGAPRYHRGGDGRESAAGFHFEDPDRSRVQDFMTPGAIAFEEDAPVAKIARTMLDKRVHRVLITRGGKLRGIVTTMDMLRALLAATEKESAAPKGRRR